MGGGDKLVVNKKKWIEYGADPTQKPAVGRDLKSPALSTALADKAGEIEKNGHISFTAEEFEAFKVEVPPQVDHLTWLAAARGVRPKGIKLENEALSAELGKCNIEKGEVEKKFSQHHWDSMKIGKVTDKTYIEVKKDGPPTSTGRETEEVNYFRPVINRDIEKDDYILAKNNRYYKGQTIMDKLSGKAKWQSSFVGNMFGNYENVRRALSTPPMDDATSYSSPARPTPPHPTLPNRRLPLPTLTRQSFPSPILPSIYPAHPLPPVAEGGGDSADQIPHPQGAARGRPLLLRRGQPGPHLPLLGVPPAPAAGWHQPQGFLKG